MTTVILAHGVFDLLHLGHIEYLERARKLGDKLIVSVTSDRYVSKPDRPIFTTQERMNMLAALRCVDGVRQSDSQTAVSAIETVRPNLYVKGIDYQNKDDDNLQAEREAVEAHGGQLIFLATPKFSSTDVIARIRGK